MTIIAISAERTISDSYAGTAFQSCRPVDRPTKERVTVELDGKTYERTVHERVIWRNMGECTTSARFVIVNGINYLV